MALANQSSTGRPRHSKSRPTHRLDYPGRFPLISTWAGEIEVAPTVMNISVKGEYALEALFDLASHRGADPVKIADIAKRRKIPQKFLELILAGLKQGGFVESRRGAEGGYFLARPANAITVGEVLRFVEG